MKQEIVDLIKYRIERSKNTLEDAKKYLSSVSLASSVNRIYYSMFYIVTALLLSKNFSSAKHIGVRAIFNKEFVKTGFIDTRLGKFYSDMFDKRQEGDYKDFVKFERADVERWLKDAEEFVNELEKKILEIIKNT